MMKIRNLIFLLLFFVITQHSKVASAITIDEFDGDTILIAATNGAPQSAVPAVSTALGGTRSMYVRKTAGGGNILLFASNGSLNHTQGVTDLGISLITWDGDDLADSGAPSDPTGLGGLDLTQDNGDSFLLKLYADLGFNIPVTFRIYMYTDGNSASQASLTINSDVFALTDHLIPFASFTQLAAPGITGAANPKNVGAIVLEIVGAQPAHDLEIAYFGTNGECPIIPVFGNAKKDQCGVCAGDGTSCLDCAGVPFGTKVVDQCKVCDGDGQSCLDCAGVPFGTKVRDQCDVCGGDGTSCLDCADQPFGTAVKDQCGICGGDGTSCLDCAGTPFGTAVVDKCNVCGGDGISCLQCDQKEISALQFELDHGAKLQERLIKRMLKTLAKKDTSVRTTKFSLSTAKKAHALQERNWILSWTLPSNFKVCQNAEICTQVSLLDFLNEYRTHNDELRKLGNKVMKRLKKAKISTSRFVKQNDKLHSKNMSLADQVPTFQSLGC